MFLRSPIASTYLPVAAPIGSARRRGLCGLRESVAARLEAFLMVFDAGSLVGPRACVQAHAHNRQVKC
jgi:hypothetical protein